MNVYYLPSRQDTNATPEIPLTASRWSVLRARTHRAWWRLRLTLAEVLSVKPLRGVESVPEGPSGIMILAEKNALKQYKAEIACVSKIICEGAGFDAARPGLNRRS